METILYQNREYVGVISRPLINKPPPLDTVGITIGILILRREIINHGCTLAFTTGFKF